MPSTDSLTAISADLLAYLVAAAEEVFEMMVFRTLEPLPAIDADHERQPANVVASVAFAGHRRGLVAFHSSMGVARGITAAMLSMPVDEVDGEIPDAIGEISNMVAGTFRNKLAAVEPASVISVPIVTIGSDFLTYCPTGARRAFCPFMLDGEVIYVELVLID